MKKVLRFVMMALISTVLAGVSVSAAEEPELLTVEEPSLTDTGMVYIDYYDEIPVDPSSLEVTDAVANQELQAILSEKKETESEEEFIRRYSAEFYDKELSTKEELLECIKDEMYHTSLQAEILKAFEDRAQVESYPEETFSLLKTFALQELQRQADVYALLGGETDVETAAADLGYASAEDFQIAEALYYGKAIMILDNLAKYTQVSYSDADVEKAIQELMDYYGYGDEMTMEEFIEMNGGEPWKFMVEKLNVEYHKVLREMEPYAVLDETMQQSDPNPDTAANNRARGPYTDLLSFTAVTIDGDTVSQELFADKDLTILNIWATWCGFCIQEMPDLAEYAAELPDNIQLVTFCTDGAMQQSLAEEILTESGISEQNVITLISGQGDLQVLDQQIMYFPTTLFFNSKGELVGEPVIGGQKDLKGVLDECVQTALEGAQ